MGDKGILFWRQSPSAGHCRKDRLFTLLTAPGSGPRARIYSWAMDALALLSILSFCCESVPQWSQSFHQRLIYFFIESWVSLSFLLDLALKTITQPTLTAYTLSWDCLIDGLSILPWAFDLLRMGEMLRSGAPAHIHYSLRLLRLLRFIRFFRITLGNVPQMGLFLRAVRRSGLALAFLLVYVFGAGLFFSGCLYFAETSSCVLDRHTGLWMREESMSNARRAPPQPCAIQNMFQAIWLCVVTMATVGYGDLVPVTPLGKGVATVIMVTSMIFLPLPAAIFGANLTELYLEERLSRRLERRRRFIHRSGGGVGSGGGSGSGDGGEPCPEVADRAHAPAHHHLHGSSGDGVRSVQNGSVHDVTAAAAADYDGGVIGGDDRMDQPRYHQSLERGHHHHSPGPTDPVLTFLMMEEMEDTTEEVANELAIAHTHLTVLREQQRQVENLFLAQQCDRQGSP